MAIRPILTIPDPLLRKKAKPVERVDDELRRLMDDMLATMYDAPGIGLAAPQIGISRRLIVMDPAKEEAPKTPLIMVNPEILDRSEEMRIHEEGCLSIPDFTAEIERLRKKGLRVKEIAELLGEKFSCPKREIYRLALEKKE